MAAKKKGIFCLEGAWWGVKDKTSVEPMLRLLETMGDYEVPYFHHDVATHEEFDFYLKKWRGRSFASHPILYLAFHGERGGIAVGEGRNNTLALDDLAEPLAGFCKGRVIHFGSCSTLDVPDDELNTFLHRTGACAVFGFRTDVGWLKSAALDLLVLGYLQGIRLAGDSSTNTGINSRNGLGTLEVPNGNGAVSCIGSIGASPLRVTIPAWVGRS